MAGWKERTFTRWGFFIRGIMKDGWWRGKKSVNHIDQQRWPGVTSGVSDSRRNIKKIFFPQTMTSLAVTTSAAPCRHGRISKSCLSCVDRPCLCSVFGGWLVLQVVVCVTMSQWHYVTVTLSRLSSVNLWCLSLNWTILSLTTVAWCTMWIVAVRNITTASPHLARERSVVSHCGWRKICRPCASCLTKL